MKRRTNTYKKATLPPEPVRVSHFVEREFFISHVSSAFSSIYSYVAPNSRIRKCVDFIIYVRVSSYIYIPSIYIRWVTPARTAAFGKLAEGGYFYETAGKYLEKAKLLPKPVLHFHRRQ